MIFLNLYHTMYRLSEPKHDYKQTLSPQRDVLVKVWIRRLITSSRIKMNLL